jgi:hypothetical protein
MVEVSHRRFYRYGNKSGDSGVSICSSVHRHGQNSNVDVFYQQIFGS